MTQRGCRDAVAAMHMPWPPPHSKMARASESSSPITFIRGGKGNCGKSYWGEDGVADIFGGVVVFGEVSKIFCLRWKPWWSEAR